MNKISLVARRRNRVFDEPTKASLRAKARMENGIVDDNEPAKEPTAQSDVSFTIEEGAPTVEVDVPQNDHVAFDDLAEEILDGKERSFVTAEVSKEKVGDKWELKLQFMPDHPSKMLNPKELATMLGISKSTVYSMRKSGKIKGYRMGRSWRFVWSEVLESLEYNKE